MVSTAFEQIETTSIELNKYEEDVFGDRRYPKEPASASEWFSKQFPQQTKIYGCPFLELKKTVNGFSNINPLSPNIDFLAAVLGGDSRLGHSVIYLEHESQFYFYDPKDKLYKTTTPEKPGNLIRALLIRCAEELPHDVNKFSLFHEFRSDKVIRQIIHRAKSILAADESFFSSTAPHQRIKGPEIYERVTRIYVEQMLERQAGDVLTVTQAYAHFTDFIKHRNMTPLKRSDFKQMLAEVIREQFDLGLRNDVVDQDTQRQTAGWKGLSMVEIAQ